MQTFFGKKNNETPRLALFFCYWALALTIIKFFITASISTSSNSREFFEENKFMRYLLDILVPLLFSLSLMPLRHYCSKKLGKKSQAETSNIAATLRHEILDRRTLLQLALLVMLLIAEVADLAVDEMSDEKALTELKKINGYINGPLGSAIQTLIFAFLSRASIYLQKYREGLFSCLKEQSTESNESVPLLN